MKLTLSILFATAMMLTAAPKQTPDSGATATKKVVVPGDGKDYLYDYHQGKGFTLQPLKPGSVYFFVHAASDVPGGKINGPIPKPVKVEGEVIVPDTGHEYLISHEKDGTVTIQQFKPGAVYFWKTRKLPATTASKKS